MEGVGAIMLLIIIGCAIVVGEDVCYVEGKIRNFFSSVLFNRLLNILALVAMTMLFFSEFHGAMTSIGKLSNIS